MYSYVYIKDDCLIYKLSKHDNYIEIGSCNNFGWLLISKQILYKSKFYTKNSLQKIFDKEIKRENKNKKIKIIIRKILFESEEKITFKDNRQFPWWKLK